MDQQLEDLDSHGIYKSDFIVGLGKSEGLAFFPNGDILIGNGSTSSIKLFDSGGNYKSDLISSGNGNLISPNAIAIQKRTNVSVANQYNNRSIIIFPNPSTGIFNIHKRNISNNLNIEVYNLQGFRILENTKDDSLVDLSECTNGFYILKLTNGKSAEHVFTA